MTADYDRISADDLSCQTEGRLDHNEGEQTTETAKALHKGARKSVKTSSATSLSDLNISVEGDNGNAQIVNANDTTEIYMILEGISDHNIITFSDFHLEVV